MSLQDRNILIVEDQLVITLDLEQAILDAGGRVIGPAADVSDALRLLNVERVDAAILDVDLQREDVSLVVEMLLDRGIPFIFHTGIEVPPALRRRCPEAPVHTKPASSDVLIASLAAVMSRPRQPEAA